MSLFNRLFADLGLAGDSVYAELIREQRGKPGDTLFERLVSLGVELLMFALSFAAPSVALTVAAAIGKPLQRTYGRHFVLDDNQEENRDKLAAGIEPSSSKRYASARSWRRRHGQRAT